METFTWIEDRGPQGNNEPSVLVAKFGDGYEQRSPNGINNNLPNWALTYSVRSDVEAQAIDAFLIRQAGVLAFFWTPFGGTQGIYKCAKWSRQPVDYNCQVVNATFQQVLG